LLYGLECKGMKKHVEKMNLSEMRMFKWMNSNTPGDVLKVRCIHKKSEVLSWG